MRRRDALIEYVRHAQDLFDNNLAGADGTATDGNVVLAIPDPRGTELALLKHWHDQAATDFLRQGAGAAFLRPARAGRRWRPLGR